MRRLSRVSLITLVGLTLIVGPAALAEPPARPLDMRAGAHDRSDVDQIEAAESTMESQMRGVEEADIDALWARKMVAHHQGAIDMARVELAHGSDPQLRRLARQSIRDNESAQKLLLSRIRARDGGR